MTTARQRLGTAASTFGETSVRILRHPANRNRRARALILYLAWQVWQRVFRRPWTIRLGEARRLRLYPHSVVAAFVLYYRVHDYEEMSFLRAYLRPGDLFVDVGANIGVYSLWASETEGTEVLAFEPSTVGSSRLVENVELNGLAERIRVVRKAVGAEPGEVRFTTGLDAMNRVVDDRENASEPVEQTTLDAELGSRVPALIKIDVEGREADVLRGGRACITRHRPALLVEVNDPDDLADVLGELGYTAWTYDPEHRTLASSDLGSHLNVLALADVDAARTRLGSRRPASGSPPTSRVPLPPDLKSRLLQRVPLLRLLLMWRDLLRDSGWVESSRRTAPVGRDGEPLPWYTYAAVDFLEGRVRPEMAVFEYGAGNSTLWWADRVAAVASVEDDPGWVARLTPSLPGNTDLRFEAVEGGGYAGSAIQRGRRFDIVVIDGADRTACAYACLPALEDDGVVIWDNADWSTLWAEGMAHLTDNGFRRIDFRGLGPLAWRPWTTSVFYRPAHNCLGI